VTTRHRPAEVADVHALATAMPHVTCVMLVRAARLGEVGYDELAEIVADAWLSRVSARRATQWLESRGLH